jgi:hypothetical protein
LEKNRQNPLVLPAGSGARELFLGHVLVAALEGNRTSLSRSGAAGAWFCNLKLKAAGLAKENIALFHFSTISHFISSFPLDIMNS